MTPPLDLAALARDLIDVAPRDGWRDFLGVELPKLLTLSHAAILDQGRIEGALAEHEKWADWANIERDYQRMLAEFEARADGAEAMAKLSHTAGRAEGLEEAAKAARGGRGVVTYGNEHDCAIYNRGRRDAETSIRALASSDPAPGEQS